MPRPSRPVSPPAVTKSVPAHPTPRTEAPVDDYRDLVVAAAAGDRAALETLLERAQHVAYRFSVMACGHAEDAEDVMQEALIKTFRYIGRINHPEFFRTWLYRTVRNACLMRRRKRVDEPARLLSLDEVLPTPDGDGRAFDPPSPGRSPEQVVVNRRLKRQLTNALTTLPGPFRVVVFLREIEGLSTREVAGVLGISEANVKTRLHRARLQLRHVLEGSHG
ncbi:MAG: sigma-70 family RNA polymerase sigma factor [Vicinamibacterales bacterium]|nr:sigma-70 family RNA polymerase sigma factor [Vicinamibacterales bacterium]